MDLTKLFVSVPQDKVEGFKTKYVVDSSTRDSAYDTKISFLGTTGQIFTLGHLYGADADSVTELWNILTGFDYDSSVDSEKTVQGAIEAAKQAVLGTAVDSSTETLTVGAVSDRVKTIETLIATDGDETIDKLQEVLDWFAGVKDTSSNYVVKIDDEDVSLGTGQAGLLTTVAENKKGLAELKAQVEALDVTDASVDNQYIAEVNQENGLISVVRAELPVIGVDSSSADYAAIGDDHEIEIKTTSLGTAVGLTFNSSDNSWTAADGTDSVAPGLAEAKDVATELVADELVIASALNDHETRLQAAEAGIEALDESYTTITTDDSSFITITDASVGSNDHSYDINVTEAKYTAADGTNASSVTDGLVTTSVMESVLADLWDTYVEA